MKIEDLPKALSQLIAPPKLEAALSVPQRYCKEKFIEAIPSIEVGKDGLSVVSIFLFSESLLCELRLDEPGIAFDYAVRTSVSNYRLKFWDHELQSEGKIVAKYDLAQVELKHDVAMLQTTISYAGNARDEWLADLIRLMPIEIVLQR